MLCFKARPIAILVTQVVLRLRDAGMHIFSSSPKHAPCANARKRRVVPTDARRGGAGVVGRSRHRPQAHSTQPKRRGVAAAAGGQSDPTDLNINGKRVTSEEAWAMMARTLRDANVSRTRGLRALLLCLPHRRTAALPLCTSSSQRVSRLFGRSSLATR